MARKAKNDRIDAEKIATLLRAGLRGLRARRLALSRARLHGAAQAREPAPGVPLARRAAARERGTVWALDDLRGVHLRRIRITGRAPDGLVFELPIGRYRFGGQEARGREDGSG